jgi:hypothetical protein
MVNDKEILTVFEKFHSARRETAEAFVRERVVRHADYALSNRPAHGSLEGLFTLMADQCTRGLINELNRFLINISHADCWVRAVDGYVEDDKSGLLWEFAEPQLELSVGRPYSLKNHFVFAVVHLLHLANSQKRKNRKDHLPAKINYKCLPDLGHNWSHFPRFLEALSRLDDRPFREATRDFRNLIHHQFRVHFDRGVTPYVNRIETSAGVAYAVGAIPALGLQSLIPGLYEQHKRATDVFRAYWRLLKELGRVWPAEGRSDQAANCP